MLISKILNFSRTTKRLIVLGVDLMLLPIAMLVAHGWLDGLVGLVIAYLPLVFLAFRFKAVTGDLQEV
jgi:Fuc2NAc and GlcNAc transferase